MGRVKNVPGYNTPVFKGKDDQRALVQADVDAKVVLLLFWSSFRTLTKTFKGFIPHELVANEVMWFYSHLGIDDTYFVNESREVISDHVIALFGAKVLAFTKHDPSTLVIDLERIDEKGHGATFIHTSPPGTTSYVGPGATCEAR
jgi:glutamate dehydrogenase